MPNQHDFSDDEIEAMVEQRERYEQDMAERLYEPYIQMVKDGLKKGPLEVLSKLSSQCQKLALAEKVQEIDNAFHIWLKVLARYEGILFAGKNGKLWDTMWTINTAIDDNAYSSIFLALNGNYESAIILCRQWLELMMTAIHFDSEVAVREKGCPCSAELENGKRKWLRGERYKPFGEIVQRVVDQDTDTKICTLAEILGFAWFDKGISAKGSIRKLYKELSQVAHMGGLMFKRHETLVDVLRYNGEYFDIWYDFLGRVHDITSLLIVVKNKRLLNLDDDKWRKCFGYDKEIFMKHLSPL